MSTENRMLIRRKGGALAFYPDDPDAGPCCSTSAGPEELCEHCSAAYARLRDLGLIAAPAAKPRAAAKPKPRIVMRAARAGDGRTSAERKADAELVADLRKLGVDKLRAEEPTRARRGARRTLAPAPRPWSIALGRSLDRSHRRSLVDGEPPPEPSADQRAEDRADDREADVLLGIIRSAFPDYPEDSLLGLPRQVLEEWVRQIEDRRDQADEEIAVAARAARASAPRPYDRAFAARRTKADREKAETRAAINTIGLSEVGPQGYTRALARRQVEADIDAGREPLADVELSEYDPNHPPRPYEAALKRRKEAA